MNHHIEWLVRTAEGILKKNGLPIDFTATLENMQHKDSLTFQAQLVIIAHHHLENEIQNGRASEAAEKMFSLMVAGNYMGLLYKHPSLEDMFHLYPRAIGPGGVVDKLLTTAIKSRQNKKTGHELAHGSEQQKYERWDKYQVSVEQKMNNNTRLNYTPACHLVAKEFGVSYETVRRRTKKPPKK